MITIGISFIVKSFKPLNIYLYNRLLEMRLVLFAVIIFMELVGRLDFTFTPSWSSLKSLSQVHSCPDILHYREL